MLYSFLGNTGIKVSRLCFGSLALGPLQNGMSPDSGSNIIIEALNKGINLIDTAELYGTYPHIRAAISKLRLQRLPVSKPVIISKSYAYSKAGAKYSIEKALDEMCIDAVDIFMLHEQESRLTLQGHREALEYYLECKQKGIVRSVGVSTHNCEVAEACAEMKEIDVIEAIVNKDGLGIGDGNSGRMMSALAAAHAAGKGIVAIKVLGGGNLIKSYMKSMDFVLGLPYVNTIAIGMKSAEEVAFNVMVIEGSIPDQALLLAMTSAERKLHVEDWCDGCGICVERCTTGAMHIIDSKASVDSDRCVICSYCAGACPVFAIKII